MYVIALLSLFISYCLIHLPELEIDVLGNCIKKQCERHCIFSEIKAIPPVTDSSWFWMKQKPCNLTVTLDAGDSLPIQLTALRAEEWRSPASLKPIPSPSYLFNLDSFSFFWDSWKTWAFNSNVFLLRQICSMGPAGIIKTLHSLSNEVMLKNKFWLMGWCSIIWRFKVWTWKSKSAGFEIHFFHDITVFFLTLSLFLFICKQP